MFWNKQQKNLKPFPSDCQTIINNLRFLSLHALKNKNANSNTKALQAAPLFYTLFRNHLVISENSNFDPISDKLVVSKNYGGNFLKTILYCASLYKRKTSFLNDLLNQDINFSNCIYDFDNSIPGQALEFSVGLAISNKLLLENKADLLAQNKIYCIFDQTDLISGRLYEAMSLAGILNLKNLIWLADFSGVEERGFFADHTLTSFKMLFKANRWNYQIIGDGSNVELLSKAINKAENSDKPSCLEINSVSGHGSSYAGTLYSGNLNIDNVEINKLKERFEYEWKTDEAHEITIKDLKNSINSRYLSVYKEYENNLKNASVDTKKIIDKFLEFKNNKHFNHFNLKTDNSLIKNILDNNDFGVALMANEFNLVGESFEKLKNTIFLGKRTSIVYGVGAGINASKYFAPFIVVNSSGLYDLSAASNQHNFLNNQCPILVYFNNENTQEKTNIYNLIHSQKNIKILFPQTLEEFGDSWYQACHPLINWWTCVAIFNDVSKATNFNDCSNSIELSKINVLVVDLSQQKINELIVEFKKHDFLVNLINVVDPEDFISLKQAELLKILSNKPYVWVGIDKNHWINEVRLDILNQKIVVKSNDDSIANIVEQIITTYNNN